MTEQTANKILINQNSYKLFPYENSRTEILTKTEKLQTQKWK